jgi:hypothetical protein
MFDLNTNRRVPQIKDDMPTKAPPREHTIDREESIPLLDLTTGKKNDVVLKSNPRRQPDKVYRSYKDLDVSEPKDEALNLDAGYKPTWLSSSTTTASKPTTDYKSSTDAGYKPTWLSSSSTTTSKPTAKKAIPVRVI